MTPVTVIVNPVSGRGRDGAKAKESAGRVLAREHVEADVHVTDGPGHARQLAASAVAGGAGLVVAWGGDGTVNEVASALVGSAVRLGIVPVGSGNGLARDLGIPSRVSEALRIAACGTDRVIDAGTVNGELFFNVAGVGLDAAVAARFASRSRRGLPGYVRVVVRELWHHQPRDYVVSACGRTTDVRSLMIVFANSRQFGSGALIAPTARLDDGALEMVVVEDQPLPRIVARVPALFRGTLAPGPGLGIERIESAAVEAAGDLPFHVDGEPRTARDRLTVAVIARAVVVRTPHSTKR